MNLKRHNARLRKFGVLMTMVCFWPVSVSLASEPAPLVESLEELKKEVLKLNRDLFILEEDLLFPSSTQMNVYVSMDQSKYFKPDGVELKVNDQTVESHLYTPHEISALVRGGLQKLYQGNVKQGEHRLVAIFTGQGPENRPYKRAVEYVFEHSGDPVHLELTIQDQHAQQQPAFKVKAWQE